MYKITLFILLLNILSGCSSPPRKHSDKSLVPAEGGPQQHQDLIPVVAALHDQMYIWEGAPYQYGGTTLKGVDCSGFIWRTLRDKFNLPVRRVTTHQLIRMGKRIRSSALQPGDLVFFRINHELHVGFYDTNRHFIHASVHHGVTKSSLDTPYWQKVFLEARRLPAERQTEINLADNKN
ncbi:NlpC/P60 family protein [Yokenella regensburgei]|uniref:NlpC/P60 family protein n=1 Tax=Yokenella regensburgei TaxID=158877 RepID=UPI003ED8CF17